MATSFNHFPEIVAKQDKLLSKAVRKTAFDLQAAIQAKIRANGQIDTGFLVSSVYVTTFGMSTYGEGTFRATRPSKKTLKMSKRGGRIAGVAYDHTLPEIEMPDTEKTAYVALAADYAYWQNYGTHSQPARPFLEPSVDLIRPEFEAALAAIEKSLSGGISVE